MAQLRQALQHRQPDVLLLGDEMFDELDAETLARLQRGSAVLHVMLMARYATPRLCDEVLRCRFHGVLPGDCSAETCERALRAVCAGEIWLPRAHLSRVVARGMATSRYDDDAGPLRQAPRASTHGALSRREQQVADFLHHGLTNKEIAGRLGIMEDTVKKHLQNIFEKLGVRRRMLVALDTASRLSSGG